MVAVEQLHEARLRAGRTLGAEHTQVCDAELDLVQIHQQLVDPEGRALADGGQLCRLEMREAEGRLILVCVSKCAQLADDGNQLLADEQQALLELDDVGVVADVGAGRTQMDDAGGLRCGLAEGVNVCHDVVTDFLLTRSGDVVVDVVDVCFHLVDLLLRDRQTELLLRLSQRHPKTSPGGELHIRRKDIQHLRACISRTKRAFINIAHSYVPFPAHSPRRIQLLLF